MTNERLPSWQPGTTRDAVIGFLDAAPDIPVTDRVAYFDNDGTLWCERPSYIQLDFLVDELRRRVAEDPSLTSVTEFAAVLSGDMHEVSDLGLERVAVALVGLFDGMDPDEFTRQVRSFMTTARHASGRPVGRMTYQPMLELIAELRALDFTVGIVTGGGTEFVRAIATDLYGVPAELVVGTLIGSQFARHDDGSVGVRRTSVMLGDANEGPAKVTNIQTQLGRRPVVAAGNSGGDREMLEWAQSYDGPHLALLVDHDDATREYAYESVAQTFAETESIIDVAHRLGWTVASMSNDWSTVFAD